MTLLTAHLLLQSWFVRPAMALLRHIQNGGQRGSTRQIVPPLWRPWFDAVSEAFVSSRVYQMRLEASEERLKAAAENLPDGLAIFDAEDRLTFFNSRYPDHLTANVRATLALGKRWPDWLREALALGPIFHADWDRTMCRRAARHGASRPSTMSIGWPTGAGCGSASG